MKKQQLKLTLFTIFTIFMLFTFFWFTPVTVFGLAAPTPQKLLSEKESTLIFQKMTAKLTQNQSLKARFVQERQLQMFGDVLRSEGYIYFEKPGKIRWEFTKPYGSLTIMLEKGEVEKYDIKNNELFRVETGARKVLAEVLNQIVSWQKGDMSQVTRNFQVKLYEGDGYLLVMKPLSQGLAKILKRLEFQIDKDSFLVHQVQLWEDEKDYTTIRFFEQKIGEVFPIGLFDLKKPFIIHYPN